MNLGRALRLFRGMVAPDRVRAEVAEELAFHIEMLTADNIGEGMSPEDARRAAERQFGPVAAIQAEGYVIRGGSKILRQASALAPIVMSLCALATVGIHVVRFGGAPETDEGSAAHIWQLLMALQIPVILWFTAKWLPRAPGRALAVLLLQAVAALSAMVPVFMLGL